MNESEKEKILKSLRGYLQDKVQFALYFGSFGTERFMTRNESADPSDIDLAVFLGHEVDLDEQMDMIAEIQKSLNHAYETDIVFLDGADPIIKKQVMDHGTPFVMNDRDAWIKFKMKSINEYIDFKIDRRQIEEKLVERYTA